MDDIAIGRKEIMKVCHVVTWATVRTWKRHHALPIRYLPNHKPMLIVKEFMQWSIKFSELTKE